MLLRELWQGHSSCILSCSQALARIIYQMNSWCDAAQNSPLLTVLKCDIELAHSCKIFRTTLTYDSILRVSGITQVSCPLQLREIWEPEYIWITQYASTKIFSWFAVYRPLITTRDPKLQLQCHFQTMFIYRTHCSLQGVSFTSLIFVKLRRESKMIKEKTEIYELRDKRFVASDKLRKNCDE